MSKISEDKRKAFVWLENAHKSCPVPEGVIRDIPMLLKKFPATDKLYMYSARAKEESARTNTFVDPTGDNNRTSRISAYCGFKDFKSLVIDARGESDSAWAPHFEGDQDERVAMDTYLHGMLALNAATAPADLGTSKKRVDFFRSSVSRPEYRTLLSGGERVVTQTLGILEADLVADDDVDLLLNHVIIGAGALNALSFTGRGATPHFRFVADHFIGPSFRKNRVQYGAPAMYVVEEDTDVALADVLPALDVDCTVSTLFQILFSLEAAWLEAGFLHRRLDAFALHAKKLGEGHGTDSPYAKKAWVYERPDDTSVKQFEIPVAVHKNLFVKIGDFNFARAWVGEGNLVTDREGAGLCIDLTEDVRALAIFYLVHGDFSKPAPQNSRVTKADLLYTLGAMANMGQMVRILTQKETIKKLAFTANYVRTVGELMQRITAPTALADLALEFNREMRANANAKAKFLALQRELFFAQPLALYTKEVSSAFPLFLATMTPTAILNLPAFSTFRVKRKVVPNGAVLVGRIDPADILTDPVFNASERLEQLIKEDSIFPSLDATRLQHRTLYPRASVVSGKRR